MALKLPRRSTRQIRGSLQATRERLDQDLTELEERLQESVSPRNFLARHPAILTAAGAIVGVLVVRNPAMIGKALTRIAQASAPFLVRSLLNRGGGESRQMTGGNGADGS